MSYEEFDGIEPYEVLPIDRPKAHPPEPTFFLPPTYDPELLRVLAVGSRPIVDRFVHWLHRENIAHYSKWTRPIRTPNPGEYYADADQADAPKS